MRPDRGAPSFPIGAAHLMTDGQVDVEIGFLCHHCGGEVLEGPDDMTDDTDVWCKACGTVFGKWGAVLAKARDAANALVQGRLGEPYEAIPGVKPLRITGE